MNENESIRPDGEPDRPTPQGQPQDLPAAAPADPTAPTGPTGQSATPPSEWSAPSPQGGPSPQGDPSQSSDPGQVSGLGAQGQPVSGEQPTGSQPAVPDPWPHQAPSGPWARPTGAEAGHAPPPAPGYGAQPAHGAQPTHGAQPAHGGQPAGDHPPATGVFAPGAAQVPGSAPSPWAHYGAQAHGVPADQAWAPQAATAPKPRRSGKAVGLVAGAMVLALVSGGVGAAGALALADTGIVRVTETREAAPVVDRSSLAEIAANVQPSVVSVKTASGEGSGVVLTADGFVLTNNHVVASGANSLSVTFSDGKTARATVVGTDARTDLAVIKAQGVSGLTAATFGNSDDMRVGDTVLALGSPLGLEGSVTAGIVSALDRTIQAGSDNDSPQRSGTGVTTISGVIQTDAAINPGNSGGALVNLDGHVIGINTAIATSGQSNGNIGVGFAIPGNKAKQVADQLMKGQKVSHAFLGVQVTPADGGGAEVTSVTSGSPAATAGLRQGDVVTKVGDTVINDSDDLVSAVQARKPGDRVEITYTRDGASQTTTVTLGEAS